MNYKRKNLYISEKTISYLEKVQNNILEQTGEKISIGKVLDKICKEHEVATDKKMNDLAVMIAEHLAESLRKDLVRIRLGTNSSDRNTQVLLEMFNHLFLVNAQKDPTLYKVLATTDKIKSPMLESAEIHVKNKIETFRQIKLDRKGDE
ncbi:hypothetical protein E2L07_16110 [Halalkalibacterium halodurans]|uniref:hypothetical protein n=1 Tax=Halalkalibacterium halodurans TaxID=86665 RepID=UPI001067A26E|nr:hypothetical protein [Halalkalibacterium halodurans]TES50316.1 hypothetical protein E2L07_16110 [Halalkalibacterium halodurans]